jgi:hypothetical protein
MRYEAYHNIAKRIGQANFNFKNIAKSISNQLLLRLCNYLKSSSAFQPVRVEHGKLTPFSADEIIDCETQHLHSNAPMKTTKWVKRNGRRFVPNSVILLKTSLQSQTEFPEYAKISKIIVQNDVQFVLLYNLKTIRFNHHYHAYEVEKTSEKYIVDLESLTEFEPQWLLQSFNENDPNDYVCARHWV